jgi:hypothetical protein
MQLAASVSATAREAAIQEAKPKSIVENPLKAPMKTLFHWGLARRQHGLSSAT